MTKRDYEYSTPVVGLDRDETHFVNERRPTEDQSLYFFIRKREDGTVYRIKKGKSSFKQSPGFGLSLFTSVVKARAVLKQHLSYNRMWDRPRPTTEEIEHLIERDYEIVPVVLHEQYGEMNV